MTPRSGTGPGASSLCPSTDAPWAEVAPRGVSRNNLSMTQPGREVAMNAYETSATVEDRGRIQVVGVLFAAGTLVEVTISPKVSLAGEDGQALAAARARMRELFSTVKGFRV